MPVVVSVASIETVNAVWWLSVFSATICGKSSLWHHAPLMGAVSDGVVVSTRADGTKAYTAVGIGVLNVVQNEVTLLVRAAEKAEDIDLERAEAAERRARERLEHRDGVDILRAEAALHRAIARQDAANMAGKRKI